MPPSKVGRKFGKKAATKRTETVLLDLANTPAEAAKSSHGLLEELPSWFIQNCVKSFEEWGSCSDSLILRATCLDDEGQLRSPTDDGQTGGYEIESTVFESLSGIVEDSPSSPTNGARFKYDSLILGLPSTGFEKRGRVFLNNVVDYFARTVSADLITLSVDDIKDLALHFLEAGEQGKTVDTDYCMRSFFGNKSKDKDFDNHYAGYPTIGGTYGTPNIVGTSSTKPVRDVKFPFSTLLASPSAKRKASNSELKRDDTTPLIVHLKDVHVSPPDPSAISYSPVAGYSNSYYEQILSSLKDTVAQSATKSSTIVILSTTVTINSYDRSSIIASLGKNPRKEIIRVVPLRSKHQQDLLEKHAELDDPTESINIRDLQRTIRCRLAGVETPVLEPYADWSFLKSSRQSFKTGRLKEDFIDEVVQRIGQDHDDDHIKEAMISAYHKELLLHTWDKVEEDILDATPESKWSSFSLEVQEVIRKIESNGSDGKLAKPPLNDPAGKFPLSDPLAQYPLDDAMYNYLLDVGGEPANKYEWEEKFLPLLVDPATAEEGWPDIALDPEIKATISTLMTQSSHVGKSAYGVLKRSRISGALLYGPPGVGKTHLARVLARESKAVTICVTDADIKGKFVGETEKAIKGLFSLARMLAPSIIFIDEADSLFKARGGGDWWYDRSLISQLLSEMDGLTRVQDPPFVLLASNIPQDLDNAVLRRVPSRLLLGLPSTKLRKTIFGIVLRDEIMDDDVKLDTLAMLTHGYSGSDIQSLCVQTALSCETFDNEGKRILKHADFTNALHTIGPTVSRVMQTRIKDFAKEYDPAGLQKLLAAEQSDRENQAKDNHHADPATTRRFSADSSSSVKSTAPALITPIGVSFSSVSSDAMRDYPPLSYTPIKNGSTGIRVLTVLNKENLGHSVGTISCTLEEVDLNDWTLEYRTSAAANFQDRTITNYHRFRYILWHAHCLGDRGQSPGDTIDRLMETDYDVPMEDLEPLEHRFNWGDFVALSYVWGDPKQKSPIIVNGCRIDVTVNLYDALNRFKNSPEAKVRKLKIWADAICINQNDLDERATEVQKMAMIYSEALFVRVWIGRLSEDVNDNLLVVKEHLELLRGIHYSDISPEVLSDPDVAYSFGIAGLYLAREPYWKRLWVVQEVAMASSTLFWYGEHAFTPKELELLDHVGLHVPFSFFSQLLTPQETIDTQRDRATMVQRRHELAFHTAPSTKLFNTRSVPDVLTLAQYSHATDPRDKVYGILALLPKDISKDVVPDYKATNTASNTYAMFSRLCFLREGNPNLLCKTSHYPKRPHGEPSWAVLKIDNHGQEYVSLLDLVGEYGVIGNYDKSKAGSGLQPSISFSDDNRFLFCTGGLIDVVDNLGEPAANRAFRGLAAELGDLWWSPKGQEQKSSSSNTMGKRPLDQPAFNDQQRESVVRMLWDITSGIEPHEASVLDIPWLDVDDLSDPTPEEGNPSNIIGYEHASFAIEEEWSHLSTHNVIQGLFRNFLQPNADMPLFGVPLRQYFQSTKRFCSNPKSTLRCATKTVGHFLMKRPLATRQGRVGSAPLFALPGDRIAVLAGCDMPMVLRPQGNCFEVVGPVELQGVMNGEVGRDIEAGRIALESIKLC